MKKKPLAQMPEIFLTDPHKTLQVIISFEQGPDILILKRNPLHLQDMSLLPLLLNTTFPLLDMVLFPPDMDLLLLNALPALYLSLLLLIMEGSSLDLAPPLLPIALTLYNISLLLLCMALLAVDLALLLLHRALRLSDMSHRILCMGLPFTGVVPPILDMAIFPKVEALRYTDVIHRQAGMVHH